MSHLVKMVRQFSKDENGAALVEYAVIFAILIAGSIATLNLVGPQLDGIFTAVTTQLGTIALN